jgi:nitrate/nitrite transporter NarK
LRLSIVPVLLGAVAPIGGMLYDRLGARIVTAVGMVICVAALALLFVVLDGQPGSLPLVMLALAIFRTGQACSSRPTTARSCRRAGSADRRSRRS